MRDDDGLDQEAYSRNGNKWLVPEYILRDLLMDQKGTRGSF
jgi:hypothetical protein